MCQPEYVLQFLEEKSDEHRTLPTHPHGGRPTGGLVALVHLRIKQSQLLVETTFAETHDAHVWECLRRILNCHGGGSAEVSASLPFFQGGFRAHQRRPDQRGSPLGQLGRLPENGAPETPSSG